jgi:hypothetical protein
LRTLSVVQQPQAKRMTREGHRLISSPHFPNPWSLTESPSIRAARQKEIDQKRAGILVKYPEMKAPPRGGHDSRQDLVATVKFTSEMDDLARKDKGFRT